MGKRIRIVAWATLLLCLVTGAVTLWKQQRDRIENDAYVFNLRLTYLAEYDSEAMRRGYLTYDPVKLYDAFQTVVAYSTYKRPGLLTDPVNTNMYKVSRHVGAYKKAFVRLIFQPETATQADKEAVRLLAENLRKAGWGSDSGIGPESAKTVLERSTKFLQTAGDPH